MYRLFIYFFFLATSFAFTEVVYPFQIQEEDDEEIIVYENWLSIQETVQDSSNRDDFIRNQISESYFKFYETTNRIVYLNFALHEAVTEKKLEIVERLSDQEFKSVSDVTGKLIDREISEDYFSIRDFSAEDIYTFHGTPIPDNLENQARDLLDHWLNNLPVQYEEYPLKASLKAQALVLGYYKLGDFDKVSEVGQYLIDSNPFPESLFTFNLFNTIAYASRVRGYYSEALKIYEDILFPTAESLGYQDRSLTIRMDYANTLFRFGNIKSALEGYEYVYNQGIQNLDPRYRPALINNLAVSYLNSGRFDQYVQFQLEAFQIAQEVENFDQQLNILSNLFVFYLRQNDTELALNYLNQALELSQQYNLPEETAGVLLSLGVYKRETENRPGEALEDFYEALKLSQQSNNYQRLFNSYIELGETYHALNDPDEAETYFNEAIKISNSRADERSHTMAIVRYSNMLTDLERYDSAENIMRDIRDDDLNQITFHLKVLGKNVLIKLLRHRGETGQALEISLSVIEEIFNWIQNSADMQTGHMRMDEEFSEAFQLHTELLHQRGNYEEAIAVTGRLRNLSRTGFYNNPLLKSQILSEEELIKDHNLSNRIEDLRSRYADATEEQKIYLANQLADANAERNNLLNRAFPNYSTSDFEELLPQAVDELSYDQMIIYFSTFEDQIFQYFITSDGIDMKSYPAGDEQMKLLESTVQSFGHTSTDLNLLHNVYKAYFAGNIPTGIEHIYMIPDGIFYRIPIEILPVEPTNSKNSYGSSRYLIEDYSVSYLNTLTDLVNDSKQTNFTYDLAGFGVSNFSEAGHPELPNLPFSPREVTNSAKQLNKFKNNQFYIDDRSTESNFRNIAGRAKIIHLATHSKVDDENPLFSSLYMYSDKNTNEQDSTENKNDGIVHAYELFDLNLNADLIFLSSCESGSGGYLKGSGILGFSRAFAYAGAKSLSINLWPIRDQTASEISSKFYASLNRGNNKADALRDARLHYLNNSNSDPYLWGAFIMYGNIDPPVNNYRFLIQLLLSGLLITGVSFIAIAASQKKTVIRSWVF